LIDRPEEAMSSVKRLVRNMIENKAIHTFLYLLTNSPCLDIKSMCLKFINFLLNQKTSIFSEYDLCSFISHVLWNLNEKKTLEERLSKSSLSSNANSLINTPD
jgi:hypothetical protein